MKSTTRSRPLTTALGVTALIGLAAGCAAANQNANASTSAVETTAAATTSTAAPVPEPTVPETSSTVAEDPSLVLRQSGIGPFEFGEPASEVIDGISAQLGEALTDNLVEYTDFSNAESGFFVSPDSMAFTSPVGREICWLNAMCIELGGDAPESLSFVGWNYNDVGATLQSIDGMTIGSFWSDFPDLVVYSACYTHGESDLNGIFLKLATGDGSWSNTNDAGESILPDPRFTYITDMDAGVSPWLYVDGGDC